MLLSLQNLFASLHTTLFKTHVMSKSGDKIGLVWSKIYMSKKCQFEDVTIIPLYYCITCPMTLSCVLASYSIPIFHTFFNSQNFLFSCYLYTHHIWENGGKHVKHVKQEQCIVIAKSEPERSLVNDIRRLILNKMDLNLVSSQPPKCALRLPA